MLSETLHNALNDQMNFEFYSAHTYLAMAAYCTSENYDGFANFFLVQAEEERFHAMKFYNFINDLGYRATIQGFESPENNFSSVLEAFKAALLHEKKDWKRRMNYWHFRKSYLRNMAMKTASERRWRCLTGNYLLSSPNWQTSKTSCFRLNEHSHC